MGGDPKLDKIVQLEVAALRELAARLAEPWQAEGRMRLWVLRRLIDRNTIDWFGVGRYIGRERFPHGWPLRIADLRGKFDEAEVARIIARLDELDRGEP